VTNSRPALARYLCALFCLAASSVPLHQAAAQPTTRSIWEGIYTEVQADRGRRLYLKECKECHGEDLSGGETAAGLIGKELVSFWSESSVGVLFEEMRETMPEETPGKLSDRVYADILAYLFKANKFPAGDEELEPNVDRLARIGISPKPE